MKRGAEETEAELGRNGHDSEGTYWSSLSAAEIAALIELLSDGIIVVDGEWRFQYLNEPAARMLSRTVDDLLGKAMWSEFSEEAGINFRVAYERALRSGRPGRLVDYYEPLQRWFEARFFPRDDGLMILLRDVTEQQRVEEELREYGDQMAEAERIVRFGVWKWTLATERVAWSDELHRIYGLEPGQFGGTAEDFIARVSPEERDRVWSTIERSIETREPFVFNERIVRPDGEERVLLSQGRPIVGVDGEVAALVGVCHDVTDRAAIEQALGASERRIHAIIDQTPAIITVKDLAGRYLMVNAEAGRVFGISPDELVGQRLHGRLSRRHRRKPARQRPAGGGRGRSCLRAGDAAAGRRAAQLPDRDLPAPRRRRAAGGDLHDRDRRPPQPRATRRATRADLMERADQPGTRRGSNARLRAADRRHEDGRAGLPRAARADGDRR